MKGAIERRRFRRAELQVPVSIRAVNTKQEPSPEPTVGQAENVSLAGVYCHVKAPCAFTPGQSVTCSVDIPEEFVRKFPFSRIAGKGSVVRVEPVPAGRRVDDPEEGSDPLIGMAIAFAPDVSALGAVEWW